MTASFCTCFFPGQFVPESLPFIVLFAPIGFLFVDSRSGGQAAVPAVNMLGMYHGSFANQVSLYLFCTHSLDKGVDSVAAMSIGSLPTMHGLQECVLFYPFLCAQ